ncbi:hypothetical protein [Nostoc flagelliforme]|uniref:hypothetical protein n=1 Tax=Nostoc flagelliforme TaxID=1306274 RepID=UPI0030DB9CE4
MVTPSVEGGRVIKAIANFRRGAVAFWLWLLWTVCNNRTIDVVTKTLIADDLRFLAHC